jgi:hypothetical protein
MQLRKPLSLLLVLSAPLLTSGCALLRPRFPAVPSAPSPPPGAPQFSVVWSDSDYNGMPQNPQWAEQRDAHQEPPVPSDENQNSCVRQPETKTCTAQDAKVDDKPPNLFWLAVCALEFSSQIHGHVDWMPATYYGEVNWIHINPGDDDYNLRMFPYEGTTPVPNGFTLKNNSLSGQQFIEMEFDSNEVASRFKTPTWIAYDQAANAADPNVMKKWLDPRYGETSSPFGVATGLFNLDCEHDCRSELHPVYALAIERDPTPSDNNWAILLRNWGNGGSCSGFNDELTLSNNQFRLLLPNTTGAPAVLWDETEFAVSNPSIPFPEQSYISGVGLLLTFTLPDPSQRSLIELSLHLRWPKGKAAPQRPKLPLPALQANLVASTATPEDAGDYVATLFDKVGGKAASTAGFRAELLAPVQDQLVAPTPELKAGKIKQLRAPKKKPAAQALVNQVADAVKQSRDDAQFRALCNAYRAKGEKLPVDKVPQLQNLCDAALAK